MAAAPHRLSIFLCHSSGDKQAVRDLYERLRADGFDPWLDDEDLLPGQDWHQIIPKIVSTADIVLVCLSRGSVNKIGYVQKEIKYALDAADEHPDNTIYLIPLKLEECDIPVRLSRWQWVSLFETNGYERLLRSLKFQVNSKVKPSQDDLQSPRVSAPTPPLNTGNSMTAHLASGAGLERHKSFLSTTSIGELRVEKKSILPRKGEEWEVIAKWDAIPELPKKSTEWLLGGYPEEHFWPKFISWRPDGNRLYTSRDHICLTSWTLNGYRIGGKQVKPTYGWANRAYWSSSGRWVLYHGTNRFKYDDDVWSISSEEGELRVWLNGGEHTGRFGRSRTDNSEAVPAFNPWRPYAEQFVAWCRRHRRFEMFDIAKFPAKVEGPANRYVAQFVDLSTLPADDQQVETFSWHPSGRYLAFVAVIHNPNTYDSVRRVHLLDWDSAQIVASTPPMIHKTQSDICPYTVAWSPGGQWLILDEELKNVWDIQTGEILSLSERERRAGWARRLEAMRHRPRGFARTSPDGERFLAPHVLKASEFGTDMNFEVWSTAEVVDSGRVLMTLPGVLDAAWSPSDPHCFATVGGDTAHRLVRIWRLKGAGAAN